MNALFARFRCSFDSFRKIQLGQNPGGAQYSQPRRQAKILNAMNFRSYFVVVAKTFYISIFIATLYPRLLITLLLYFIDDFTLVLLLHILHEQCIFRLKCSRGNIRETCVSSYGIFVKRLLVDVCMIRIIKWDNYLI